MKSSRKRKVTAAFFAAAALGGVAHAAPTINMNDLVGSNTTAESTTQATTNVVAPVVRPVVTQPTPPITQSTVVTQQQSPVIPIQVQQMVPVQTASQQMVPMQTQPLMQTQTVRQQTVTTQAPSKVTPLIPRVRPVPVTDTAKALSQQHMAVSQPQYVVNKQTNTVMEPTLAMHSLMNVQRKTEPVTVQKQVDGKQQIQTTQVQRTPVVVQEQSTMPLTVANTTTTKPVVAKQKLTIRDIQRAERERIAQLEAEEAAKQSGVVQVDQQMAAQKQAEAQRQAAILAEQQRQMALQAEQQRIAQQQAEAQRQAAMQAEQQRAAQQAALRAEQERIAAQQAEQQRIAAQQAEQQRIAAEQAEAQRQAALKAEQERIAAQQAEQQRIAAEQAEAQRQAALKAEQERIAAQQAEQQRIAAQQAEQQRIAADQAEAQRQAALKAEQERIAAQQAEQQRIAAEQAEAQRQAALKAEQERIAAQQAEQQRIAAEQAEAQRQAALKAEQERIAAQQAEQQRIAAQQAEQQRIAAEQAEAQRQAALKAERERILAQQAEEERLAAEEAARQRAEAAAKAEAERQAALRAEQERIAAQQAEQQRIAAEQAEAQRQAALKAEQERIAAEKAKAEREAAIKAEQERIAAQQAEIARQNAIKEEQERLAAEQLAKEEAEAAAKAQAEAEAKAKAEAEAKAKAQAEAEAKAKAEAAAKAQAEAEAKAKAQAEAEEKAKAEAEANQAQESKLPQSYVDARNEASTKGSAVTEEKEILSQPMEPPLQADASAKISLAFDVKNYESMSTTVDNKEIKYRAFEYIPYVANPIDIDQQYMNIYVPEEYFNNGTVNGYTTQTAPIFMPNAVGGYMPSQALTPKVENGKPNSVLYALSRGYVVASPATRGRTNKASDGNFIGKAPAVIVDLQAATAYLHANDSTMPGNANRIITNGTSAGGAVSLLQGATGNSSDFQPYLQALGAATAATNVYAVSAYAPITNLDAADMAYEWSYNGITSFNKVTMGQGELPQANVGGNAAPPQRTIQRVNLNADDVAYSNLLSEHFPEYVNNLQLHDSMGRVLKLDKNGNGTFKNYVKAFIIDAANKAQAKGTDLSKHTYLVHDNKTGTIKDINWEAYNQFVSRSKAPGAFDSRSNDSGENNLFGTSTTDNNHFTITAALHDTTSNPETYVQNAKVVTMMNPMNYLGSPAATNAHFYRIRYGTADSNTSVAIPLIVGTRAQNLGYKVDMSTPFDVDHSGDYDLDELFNWMDNIVKNGR
ncbi:subtype B tannase [uncultured Veillonella sp.]|uniref:subtype B tannase n=1 Tax=uncultured Veillonella sp. TaxID=159268 RepID=UPI002628EB65|nr:subtype B tannase [uncultured Veillonella sp.]